MPLRFLDQVGKAAQRTWTELDRRSGGILPGGGVPGPLTKPARDTLNNLRGMNQAVPRPRPRPQPIRPNPARSPNKPSPIQDLLLRTRDAVLDATPLGLPEKTFIRVNTGGVPGGTIRELPQRTLEEIKFLTETTKPQSPPGAWVKPSEKSAKWKQQGGIDITAWQKAWQQWHSSGQSGPPPNPAQFELKEDPVNQGPRSGQYSSYSSGSRDLRYTLGSFGVYFDKEGNALIKDTWKVDKSKRDRPGWRADLMEGGNLAQLAFATANKLGTFRETPIEVRIPKEEWDRLQARQPGEDQPGKRNGEYNAFIQVRTPYGQGTLDPTTGDLVIETPEGEVLLVNPRDKSK